MRVDIYKISKRVNSTALPSNLLASINFVYKDAQSKHNPVIIIDKQDTTGWNYAKIDIDFFWINDIVYAGNHIELHLQIDVLATYRANIFNTSAFCLRANEGSIYQIDSMNPATVDIIESKVEYSIPEFSSLGSYLLTVAGGDIGAAGAASQYVLTKNQMSAFMSKIFSDDITSAWKNYWDTVFDTWDFSFNPFEWVLNCRWIPISHQDWPGLSVTSVKLGRFDTGAAAYSNSGSFITGSITIPITIPKNAFFSSRYYDMNMYLPFYGMVSLPVDSLYSLKNMYLNYYIDTINGDIIYSLSGDTDNTRLLGIWGASCATNIPISAAQSNFSGTIGAVASVLGVVGAAATGGASLVAGATVGAVGATAGAVSQATQVSVQTNGALSSRIGIALGDSVRIMTRYHVPVSLIDSNSSTIGLPVNQNVIIGNKRGYVKTLNASVSANATMDELQEINNYLDGGIYVE